MQKKISTLPFKGTPEQEEKLQAVIAANRQDPSRLMGVMQQAQDIYGYLPFEVQQMIADGMNVPLEKVYGVATFYAHFSMQPKGKYIIKLCDGTACHVKKSHSILHALYEKLKLSDEKRTTDDLLFTVETVSCLGACGLAPVMLVNDSVHGQMTPEKTDAIIDQVIAEEKAANQ